MFWNFEPNYVMSYTAGKKELGFVQWFKNGTAAYWFSRCEVGRPCKDVNVAVDVIEAYFNWKLWLDDDAGKEGIESFRNPPDNSWKVAHSSAEAIALIDKLGPPRYISFDHDLGLLPDGTEDTAKVVCKYLAEHFSECALHIDYEVHSMNPAGAVWIDSYMDSWKRSLED